MGEGERAKPDEKLFLRPSSSGLGPSAFVFVARPLPVRRRIPLLPMKTLVSLLASGLLLVTSLHAQDDPKSKAVMDKLIAKSNGKATPPAKAPTKPAAKPALAKAKR